MDRLRMKKVGYSRNNLLYLHGCAEEAQGIILLPLSRPKACNCLESHQCAPFKEIHSVLLKTSNCKVIVVGQPSSSLRLLQGRLLQ